MKRILLLLKLAFFITISLKAQSDSSTIYFTKELQQTSKDSAFSYLTFVKENTLWHGKEYYSKRQILKSEGNYNERDYTKPVGSVKNYKEDGSLYFTSEYDNNSKISEKTFFYKDGHKKAWISYSGDNQQKGWDESGKELTGFIVEREARFKGGAEGWRKFLEKHLNANVANESGAPPGQYSVKVQFIVSKEGYVSNVKAVEIPKACKPCAAEVVSVLVNGPQWEPAIQDGEPVRYQAIQYVTFVVAEGDKKGRRN